VFELDFEELSQPIRFANEDLMFLVLREGWTVLGVRLEQLVLLFGARY
jgi:hypothetical protein